MYHSEQCSMLSITNGYYEESVLTLIEKFFSAPLLCRVYFGRLSARAAQELAKK
jgi:hypothetical protein